MKQKDAILHVHHLQKCKLHELQHLQALLMLWIHLWRCVTPRKVLHHIFLRVIKHKDKNTCYSLSLAQSK